MHLEELKQLLYRVGQIAKMNGILQNDLEKQLLDKYGGGKSNLQLPQSLLFDHVSPATRLLEKRRQMFEVEDALINQKEEFARREEAFHRREDGLRRKDLDLQESLLKFNKFLKENEAKRQRALKRASEEKKLCEEKNSEIQDLQSILNNTIEEDKRIKIQLGKYIQYQEYLENVVANNSKYFSDVADVLNRYKILRENNLALVKKQNKDNNEHDAILKEYLTYLKSKENEALATNNNMATMRESLVKTYTDSQVIEENIEKRIDNTIEKVLSLGQVVRSINHIYARADSTFRARHNKQGMKSNKQQQSSQTNGKTSKQTMNTSSSVDDLTENIKDTLNLKTSKSSEKFQSINNTSSKDNEIVYQDIELAPLSVQYKYVLEKLDYISGCIIDLTEVCDEYKDYTKQQQQLQSQNQYQAHQLQQPSLQQPSI